jgi:poly(hydroxyalkanoate) granule-associated protein
VANKLEELAAGKDAPFGKAVLDSATQIWLAGLGAFSKAQDEGTKIFESLVKEGERVQKHARGVAETTVADVRDRAADTWDKLEDVFEDRVSRAMAKLSVPTKKDVEALRAKVEELTAAVDNMPHTSHRAAALTHTTRGKAQKTRSKA